MQQSLTLGGRSSFLYSYSNGKLYIQFGSLKKPLLVDNSIIEQVKLRVDQSSEPEKYMASNYNKTKWGNCKNNRICPYVAKLIITGVLV